MRHDLVRYDSRSIGGGSGVRRSGSGSSRIDGEEGKVAVMGF